MSPFARVKYIGVCSCVGCQVMVVKSRNNRYQMQFLLINQWTCNLLSFWDATCLNCDKNYRFVQLSSLHHDGTYNVVAHGHPIVT